MILNVEKVSLCESEERALVGYFNPTWNKQGTLENRLTTKQKKDRLKVNIE